MYMNYNNLLFDFSVKRLDFQSRDWNLSHFIQITSFVFYRRMKVLWVWNDMRVSIHDRIYIFR